MQKRRLGTGGPWVSSIGLGCMGMSQMYGAADEDESLATLHHAIDLGVTLLDTAASYGEDGGNERLVGKVLADRRDEVVVATKFGIELDAGGNVVVDASPEVVASSCDASLTRLGIDHIDLYYVHRVDPTIPVEETVGAMAELVTSGKVGHLGLSEVTADTLRRASSVHQIAALQSEWSLWTRDIEAEILGAAREVGTAVVPYSPLGRGFLTGALKDLAALDSDDFRLAEPRFKGENFDRNLELVRAIQEMSDGLGCLPSQLALAWLMAQGDDVVPIPGTKRRKYLEENLGAADLTLSQADLDRLDELAPPGAAFGARYEREHAYGETPPAR
jgi:aryl-alcohol dehydrogenase-like predicted oxidoreductase